MFASASALGNDIYSVYFVRHAEKDRSNPEDKNPHLCPCGLERAQRLAEIFKGINLQALYSTAYVRTRDTALPIAMSKNLAVEIYNPANLTEVLERLRTAKQDALVIGHSNTTSVLAGLLADIELTAINDQEYDRLYQVVIADDHSTLQLLHQAFHCE
jgi:broad specificity phosphatase PhoE